MNGKSTPNGRAKYPRRNYESYSNAYNIHATPETPSRLPLYITGGRSGIVSTVVLLLPFRLVALSPPYSHQWGNPTGYVHPPNVPICHFSLLIASKPRHRFTTHSAFDATISGLRPIHGAVIIISPANIATEKGSSICHFGLFVCIRQSIL